MAAISLTKRCRKCHVEKPLGDFALDHRQRDGRTSWCKECKVESQRERRRRLSASPISRSEKRCSDCGRSKPITEFPSHRGQLDGHSNTCLPCSHRRSDERREQGPSERPAAKECPTCGLVKPASEFGARKVGNGLASSCRTCMVEIIQTSRLTPEGAMKYAARQQLKEALRHGEIIRGCCVVCGLNGSKINGHHEDYSQPLEVVWLCGRHHRRLHGARERSPSLSLDEVIELLKQYEAST